MPNLRRVKFARSMKPSREGSRVSDPSYSLRPEHKTTLKGKKMMRTKLRNAADKIFNRNY